MPASWIPIAEPGPRVTEADVRRFEREFGYELPADYREFLLEVNGGHAPGSHCVFTIRRRGRRSESTLNSLFSLDAGDSQDDLAAAQKHYDPLTRLPAGLLEIGYDGMGGRIILPLVEPHRWEIWYLNTEDDSERRLPGGVDWFKRRDVWTIAGSFRGFVDGLRPHDAPPIPKVGPRTPAGYYDTRTAEEISGVAAHWIPMAKMGARVTEADISRYEHEFGYELPEDYRRFLVDVNGGRPSLERSVFRLREGRCTLMSLLGLSDLEDYENDLAAIQRITGDSRDDLPKEVIAIGFVFHGLVLLVVDGPRRGEVWFLDTLNSDDDADVQDDWFHRSDVLRIAGSFREFVDGLGPQQVGDVAS